jgi:tetratricopeptide (TPR) repeat protein
MTAKTCRFFTAVVCLCIIPIIGCSALPGGRGEESFMAAKSDEAASRGMDAYRQGDYKNALQRFMEAFRIDHGFDNRRGELRDLVGLGMVLVDTGDYARARGYLDAAVKLAGERKDHQTLSEVYFLLARADYLSGENDSAAGHIDKSLQMDYGHGHVAGEKLDLKAHICIRAGRLDEALAISEESLKFSREKNLRPEVASSLRTIALVKSLQKRTIEAMEYYSDAYEIDRETGGAGNIALDLESISELQYKEGHRLTSAQLLEKSYIVSLNSGDLPRALRSLDRMISIYNEIGDIRKVRFFTGIKEGIVANTDVMRSR